MWIIFIGIRVPVLVYLGAEVYIWWTIRIFRFLVLLKFVDSADGFHDEIGPPGIYQKIANLNQNISPVYPPYG